MLLKSSLLTFILLSMGCGNARFQANLEPDQQLTCAVQDDTSVCDDGNTYILPEDSDDGFDETIIVIVVVPEDNDVVCEKDNRNGKKCFKRKKK